MAKQLPEVIERKLEEGTVMTKDCALADFETKDPPRR